MSFYESLLNSPTRLAFADFLNFEFLNNGIWFLNIWTFVHFIVGGLLMWVLIVFGLKPKARWITFLAIIILYEVFEIIMSAGTNLFIPEPAKDVIWDIIIASIAAGIVEFIFWIKSM